MERPESHILSDESNLKFEMALPRDWVKRKQNPDYGYDYDIQIFENKHSTPFHFYVQLKSTASEKISKEGAPFVFETKYFELYSQGSYPAMLCLYIKNVDKLLYLWIDDYLNKLDLNGYKDINIQQYKTLYLKKEITPINNEQLEMEVKRLNYFRNPNFLADDVFEINLFIIPGLNNNPNLFKKIFLYFFGRYSIKYFKLLESKDIKKSNLVIDLRKKIAIINYDSESIKIPINLGDKKLFPSLAISIGLLLSNSGYSNKAADLVLSSLSDDIQYLDENYIFTISIFISIILHKGNKSMHILELSEQLKNYGKIKAAEFLSVNGNFIVSLDESINKLYKSKYIEFNESLLLVNDSDSSKGISYYNMANALSRSLGEFRKAIKYYFKSRKLEPEYGKRPYWWAELGGCFFLINKFKLSENFYRKSLELGEDTIPSQALMADAILYQGRYSEATKEFELYLENKDHTECSFILKHSLCIFLSHHFEDKPRNTKESLKLTDDTIKKIIKTGINSKLKEKLKKAIYLDPLCGLAWYNYAVAVSNEKDDERFLEWLVTSILQPNDQESWTNALTSMFFESIMTKDPFLFGVFASQAISNFGNSIFISMENILREQKQFSDDLIKETMDSLKKTLTRFSIIFKEKKSSSTLRILK